MSKAKKTRPDPLDFNAALTWEQFKEAVRLTEDVIPKRNLVFAILTQSGHELAQSAWTHGNTHIDLMKLAMDYQKQLEAELGIVKSAVARMIVVGQELCDHGRPAYVTGDPEPAAIT